MQDSGHKIYKPILILLMILIFYPVLAVECALNISVIDSNNAPVKGIVFQIFAGHPAIDDKDSPIMVGPPASDGKDNDGDGLIDESDEDFNGYATLADGKVQVNLPNGDYTLVGFSQEKHVLLVSQAKSNDSVTLNIGNTVPVNISCRDINNSPIPNAEVFFRPTKRARSSVGYSDNKGQLKAYVSEGMYNIVLWSVSGEGPHYLVLPYYTISKPSANVFLHVSELPIAKIQFNLPQTTAIALFEVLESTNTVEYTEGVEPEIGYDAAYTDFYPLINSKSVFTLSANISYNFNMSFALIFGEGLIYAYEIRPPLHLVKPGTYQVGMTEKDSFKLYVNSDRGEKSPVYAPGEKVQLYYYFIDDRGNTLSRILNFTGARLIYPMVTIRDPNGIPIANNYGTLDFSKFEFILPKSAITGEYKAEIALDAGIYGNPQGVFNFYVQPTTDTSAPNIDVSMPNETESGIELKINAKITDDSGSISSFPIMRISNDGQTWKDITMSSSQTDIYQAIVPSSFITYGDLNWQIIAQDLSGNKAVKSGIIKVVDTTPPIINHNVIIKAELGTPLKITADVKDNSSVKEVTLYYAVPDGVTKSVIMSKSGDAYSTYIDGVEITVKGLNYYISATDIAGNIAFVPSINNSPKFAFVTIEDTTPPFISHNPIAVTSANTQLKIDAIINDNSGYVEATLFYKNNLDQNYRTIKMSKISGVFTADIPPLEVIAGTLNYHIVAKDAPDTSGKSRTSQSPPENDYIVQVVSALQENLAKIEIMPASSMDNPLKIKVGESFKFSVIGRSKLNEVMPADVVWLVTDGIGHINQDGLFIPYGHIVRDGKGKITAIAINAKSDDKPIVAESYIQVIPNDPAIITLNPTSVVISAGNQHIFFANVTDIYSNKIDAEIKWRLDSKDNIGTIYSTKGTQSIIQFNKTGTGKLVAEYKGLTASCDINVISGKLRKIAIGTTQNVKLPYIIQAGKSLQFTAMGYDDLENQIPVIPIWSIRGNIGTINSNGVFIGGIAGNGEIVATLGDVSSSVNVEVIPGELYSVSVMPYTAYIPASTDKYKYTYQFTAVGRDIAGNIVPLKSVSWRTDALAGTISSSGLFTAITDPGIRIGEIIINGTVFARGTSLSGYSVEGAGYVVIQKNPASKLAEVKVIVQGTSGGTSSVNITTGNTIQFEAVGKDQYGRSISITPSWSVSGGIGYVDVNGLFTATKPGKGAIFASFNGFTGLMDITVTTGTVKSIKIKPDMIFLNPRTKVTLIAIGYDSYENVVPIDNVQWSVSDNSLIMDIKGNSCTIEVNPELDVINTLSKVSAKVGDLMAFSNVFMNISKAVMAYEVKRDQDIKYFLRIEPDYVSVLSGNKYQFNARAYDILGNEITAKNLTWGITSGIGSISEGGLFSAIANSPQNLLGYVIVTDGKVYASAVVNVLSNDPKINSIAVYPYDIELLSGSIQKLVALMKTSDNIYIPPKEMISWKVIGNNGIIDGSGHFKATAIGKGYVDVSALGLSVRCNTTTLMGEIAKIEIQPSSISLKSDQQQKLKLIAEDNMGNTLNLSFDQSKYPIQISGNLGTIDQSGLWTSREFGTGYMMVSDKGMADIKVSVGDIAELNIYPKDQRITSGGQIRFYAVCKDKAGNLIPVNPVWELSGNADIGTLSADGLFIADKVGNGRIIAKVGELSNSVNIEVTTGTPSFVIIEPSIVSISSQSAEKRNLSIILEDLRGNIITEKSDIKIDWNVVGDIGIIDQTTGVFTNKTGLSELRIGYINVKVTFYQGTNKEINLYGRSTVILQPIPKPLVSIAITPNSVSVIKGDTQKFIAVGKDTDGVGIEIKPQWRVISSDGNTEIKGAISAEGVFSTTNDMNIGSNWRVQASVINSEGKTIVGEATINITAGSLQTIEIVCDKDCSKPIESGKTLELTANGYDKFRNVVEISPNWKVIGQIGTISPSSKNKAIWTAGAVGSGEVVAESGGKEGRVHLTVVHGKLISIRISTNPPQSDEKIGSTASNPLIIKSGTIINFTATGFDSDKDERGLTKSVNSFNISPEWSVQSSNLGTMTATGKFTAKTIGDGYIEARSDNISAMFYIKVVSGSLYSIKISPSAISLVSGKDTEYKFTAIGYDQQGNQVLDFKPNWKTTGEIGNIDEAGTLKVAVLPSGVTSISGSVVAFQGTIEAVSTVKIVTAIGELAKIVLTIEPSIIKAGEKAECSVKGFDDLGNPIKDLPNTINFNISKSLGLLIPSQNIWIFQAIEKLPSEINDRKGKIIASVEVNGKSLVADADFSLVPAELDKIIVEPSNLTISAGEEQHFKAYGYDAYGNIKDLSSVEWTVIGGIGRTIKDSQSPYDCIFIAEKSGKGQLIVTSQNHDGKADIQVNYGQIKALEIQPKTLTIESGKTQKFVALGKDYYGNIADDLKIQWQVTDENIGSITDDGIFTAKKAGNTTIKASYKNVSDSASVTVAYGEVFYMEIVIEYEGNKLEKPYNLISGSQYWLYAKAIDKNGNEIQKLDGIAWKLQNERGIINPSDNDKFILTALFPGQGEISASIGKVSDNAVINIVPYSQKLRSSNDALIKIPFDGKLEIPSKSLKKDETISISLSETIGIIQSAKRIGYIYKFEPSGLIFANPAKLTLSYKYVNTSDIDEDRLSIYFWDKFQQKWLRLGGYIDSGQKTITADINSLSLFTIIQEKEQQQVFSQNFIEVNLSPNAYFAPDINRLTIRYMISWKSYQLVNVTINIYDIKGRLIKELVDKVPKYPGWSVEQWDGTDESGKVVKNGRYFIVIIAESDGEKVSKTSHLAVFR